MACDHIFRYRKSVWLSSKGSLVTRTEWVPMRRLSCRCGQCCSFEEDARQAGADQVDLRFTVVPKDGRLYRAVFVGHGRDPETGHIEDWHWHMVPHEEAP